MAEHRTGFWETCWRIYKKDTILEWKSPAGILSVILFAFILAALYNYAMEADVFRNRRNLNGVMMATLFFSAVMLAGRNIQQEREGGALRVMLISPADPAGYFMGKVAALWQLQTAFILIYVPIYHFLLLGRIPGGSDLVGPFLTLALSALSLSALGILLSYIASGNRLREIILPLLLMPAALPVFMLATDALGRNPKEGASLGAYLILAGPAVIFCSLGCLLYHTLSADE